MEADLTWEPRVGETERRKASHARRTLTVVAPDGGFGRKLQPAELVS